MLDQLARADHPLKSVDFSFPVHVLVKGKEREGRFIGNDYVICLRKGEEYEIEVLNRSAEVVCMRLLVDGLNTLLQKSEEKLTETDPQAAGFKGRAVVSLDNARAWILQPKEKLRVSGFETRAGEQGEMAAFTVVRAEHSLAARQNFTDQIGLITAAFYAKDTSQAKGAVGTAAGRRIAGTIQEIPGIHPGKLLAVVHIRYVDAEDLETAAK
jgi:hypothetical protein